MADLNSSSLRNTLASIAEAYETAKQEGFAAHPVAGFIRNDAAAAIRSQLTEQRFLVKGSAGQGTWTAVPWIAVFDPLVTTGAMQGYYVVYLFAADMGRIYLSLNQGTTRVREEFGRRTTSELNRRAALMRDRVPEFEDRFDAGEIDLASQAQLPLDYEAGHGLGKAYLTAQLPEESELTNDLREVVSLYELLTARNGLDSIGVEDDEAETGGRNLTEVRRYKLHRRIERNPALAKEAKRIHGYVCQACGFDFGATYGDLGAEYIEAHHLQPLGEMPEGVPKEQDPKVDFAVLCANCHRMIHRKDAPKSVEDLASLIRT